MEYKEMSDEKLRNQLKNNKFAISKSYGLLGKDTKGSAKEGYARRLRKENARILTVLNERNNKKKEKWNFLSKKISLKY